MPVIARGHGNGLHPTPDVRFREDNCRLRVVNTFAMMGILRRAVLNMARVVQRHVGPDVPIGLLRDRMPAMDSAFVPELGATWLPCYPSG